MSMTPLASRDAHNRPPQVPPMADQTAQPAPMGRLRKLLEQPFVGFAPWILLSLIEGPDRLVLAAVLACGLAVATTVAGAAVSVRPKVLDIAGIAFFGALAAWAALADPGTSRWLGVWAGELSNGAIALITVLSLLVHRPFTLQYARETTEREYWTTPLFLRINYVITAAWAVVFAAIAIVGSIGDGPLHQPDNLWTNWLVPIALIVFATKFTNWYPNYATAEVTSPGTGRSRAVHHADLLRPLSVYLMPVGIVVMVLGGAAWWAGAVLLVAGVIVTRKLHQIAQADATAHAADGTSPNRPMATGAAAPGDRHFR
jgi:hypothetical protein